MSTNPLEDDPERDRRIEVRAHQLWEADGRPHGRHDEHWERARELVAMEDAGRTGQLPNPTTIPGHDPTRAEPIEEAFIQENLGEFPDRFADQGDATPTPRTRKAARAKLTETPDTGAAGPAADAPSDTGAAKKTAKPKAAKTAGPAAAEPTPAAEPAPAPESAKKSRKKG